MDIIANYVRYLTLFSTLATLVCGNELMIGIWFNLAAAEATNTDDSTVVARSALFLRESTQPLLHGS